MLIFFFVVFLSTLSLYCSYISSTDTSSSLSTFSRPLLNTSTTDLPSWFSKESLSYSNTSLTLVFKFLPMMDLNERVKYCYLVFHS